MILLNMGGDRAASEMDLLSVNDGFYTLVAVAVVLLFVHIMYRITNKRDK